MTRQGWRQQNQNEIQERKAIGGGGGGKLKNARLEEGMVKQRGQEEDGAKQESKQAVEQRRWL